MMEFVSTCLRHFLLETVRNHHHAEATQRGVTEDHHVEEFHLWIPVWINRLLIGIVRIERRTRQYVSQRQNSWTKGI